jgi:Tol biopolymer transport system component
MASPFGLQIASPSTGVIQTLSETSEGAIATYPSWGPDGKIAYTRGQYGDPRLVLYEESELWTIDEDGSNPQPLVTVPGQMAYFPDWNPKGRWIAFTQAPPDPDTGTIANPNGRILLYDTQDHVVVEPDDLNAAVPGGKSWPTWSNAGNRLTCGSVEDQGRDSDIYMSSFDLETGVDWEARRLTEISTGFFEHIPEWAP